MQRSLPDCGMTAEGRQSKMTYQWTVEESVEERAANRRVGGVGALLLHDQAQARPQRKLVLYILSGIFSEDDSEIVALQLFRHYDSAKPLVEIYIA
jgi:hypothetical protein